MNKVHFFLQMFQAWMLQKLWAKYTFINYIDDPYHTNHYYIGVSGYGDTLPETFSFWVSNGKAIDCSSPSSCLPWHYSKPHNIGGKWSAPTLTLAPHNRYLYQDCRVSESIIDSQQEVGDIHTGWVMTPSGD